MTIIQEALVSIFTYSCWIMERQTAYSSSWQECPLVLQREMSCKEFLIKAFLGLTIIIWIISNNSWSQRMPNWEQALTFGLYQPYLTYILEDGFSFKLSCWTLSTFAAPKKEWYIINIKLSHINILLKILFWCGKSKSSCFGERVYTIGSVFPKSFWFELRITASLWSPQPLFYFSFLFQKF